MDYLTILQDHLFLLVIQIPHRLRHELAKHLRELFLWKYPFCVGYFICDLKLVVLNIDQIQTLPCCHLIDFHKQP